MKSIFSLLVFLGLPYCFAQTNSMDYFYEGKEKLPDFAALAVLESQNCPNPIAIKNYEYNDNALEEYNKQLCTSRYRIIRVLDAAFDTIRKEFLEVKEKPMFPSDKYMPMLIFGEYRNGAIEITGYESPRYLLDFYPFADLLNDDIVQLHSIGTPYFNLKNLDSFDAIYYAEYMAPHIKYKVEAAGKNFGELLLRLTQNRTLIKTSPIKSEFAALGAIKSIRQANDSKQANLYELNITIKNLIKNNARMGPNTAIFIDRKHLPSGWSCQPFDYYLDSNIVFYFLGDLKQDGLFIDSLVSPLDAFIFGDTIYDISMGFPFEKLITYFFPPNISFEEFKFGLKWNDGSLSSIRNGKFPMEHIPKCQRNALAEIARKWGDFLDNRPKKKIRKWIGPFIDNTPWHLKSTIFNPFRCRPYSPCVINNPSGCRQNYFEDEMAVWGSISIINPEGTGQVKIGNAAKTFKVKSKRGALWLKYAAGDVRTTACKVRFDEEMTIVKELEGYLLVKASCGQGWLRKADVEKVGSCDECRKINKDEFIQGPCMPL